MKLYRSVNKDNKDIYIREDEIGNNSELLQIDKERIISRLFSVKLIDETPMILVQDITIYSINFINGVPVIRYICWVDGVRACVIDALNEYDADVTAKKHLANNLKYELKFGYFPYPEFIYVSDIVRSITFQGNDRITLFARSGSVAINSVGYNVILIKRDDFKKLGRSGVSATLKIVNAGVTDDILDVYDLKPLFAYSYEQVSGKSQTQFYAIFNVKNSNGELDTTHRLFAGYSSVKAMDAGEATNKIIEKYNINKEDFEIVTSCPCSLKTKIAIDDIL